VPSKGTKQKCLRMLRDPITFAIHDNPDTIVPGERSSRAWDGPALDLAPAPFPIMVTRAIPSTVDENPSLDHLPTRYTPTRNERPHNCSFC